MKKIYIALVALATALTGCKTADPFFTAGEDDYPRILNTDLEEQKGGKPIPLANITRADNFNFEVIVTPTAYTTVSWFIDGVKVFEGNEIDMPMLAGDYNVKIVATTTKGLETYRNCTLKVLPVAGDPELASDAKSRWLNPGASTAITGTGIDGITGLLIEIPVEAPVKAVAAELYSYLPVEEFSNDGSKISYKVPASLPEGEYRLIAQKGDEKFGCGLVTVSNEKYVEPGMVEKVLWEGSKALNWDAENIKITADDLAAVPAGTDLMIYFEKIPAAELAEVYWALRIVEPSWTDASDILPQTDFGAIDDSPYILQYTDARKSIVDSKGSMSLVGNGLKITRISYMAEGGAAVEKKIWEGETEINWGTTNVNITPEQLADVPIGTEITLTYVMVDMPEAYHALRVTTPSWGDDKEKDDLVPQVDNLNSVAPESYTFVYDEKCKNLVESRGGMLVVGYGFKLTKVSYMAQGAAEKEVWKGETEINWGTTNVTITPEQLADVKTGAQITLTYVMVDMPEAYHALRVTTPSWGDDKEKDDLVPQVDDLATVAPESYSFTYDEKCVNLVNSRNGMLIVGYGFKLTRVTVK